MRRLLTVERQQTIWGPRPVAPTGRPAQRSRSDFVAAAIAIAEHDGLAAVTMRRVATELGTGAASAYRHLGSHDDLVDLMIDQVLEAYEPPALTGDPYNDVVDDLVQRLRFIREHLWLVDAIEDRPTLSPQRIRLIEISLERLADHPAAGPTKIEALTLAAAMLSIQARQESRGHTLDPKIAQAQVELLQQSSRDGAHPHLANALSQPPPASDESSDERFARVLRRVLEGLLPPFPDGSPQV